ncbi:hypothetical protein [Nannocystis punicea]|uniref:Lipoprotein n=1 Tax=Nannocystis punicea TaxID=2995304 RepID=A0ABY7H173_9BACT|nr:hypothetical protein [Nannocystis poenicansa]WAS92769.1 hypothetical protein O0S08_41875 [Nannocystis poenicansa]
MRHPRITTLFLLALSSCAEEDEGVELPEISASSKYVAYGTWADTSTLCMDDRLARWDTFIERVADFLDISPPSSRIRYTWVPEGLSSPERWGCADSNTGCFKGSRQGVFVREFEIVHELVHVVGAAGLGRGHPILSEGLAEYLGSFRSTETKLEEFPDEFRGLIDSGGRPESYGDYTLSMHFVGATIERHGASAFTEFYRSLSADVTFEEFESTYQAVFAEDLSERLLDMSLHPVLGQFVPWACRTGSGAETLDWSAATELQATIHGECGDPHFVGPGHDSPYDLTKDYVIEVESAGGYRLEVTEIDAAKGLLAATLESCPGVPYGRLVVENGYSFEGTLSPGRHVLTVYFPPTTELEGDADVALKLLYPVPP